jgi:hypothetical protein
LYRYVSGETTMSLPDLQRNWQTTIHSLHRATQILGALRLLLVKRVPNWLELSLTITLEGLSTGILPGGSEVSLDFGKATMTYQSAHGAVVDILLSEHSQLSLTEKLLEVMKSGELIDLLANAKPGNLIDSLLAGIKATKHPLAKTHDGLDDETQLVIDNGLATDYAAAVYTVFTGVARFRARLTGYMTPIVVWPEHFDLSTIWFATENPTEKSPHMNFGFAPFSPGIPRPYLYAYAWPMVEGVAPPSLEAPARWETEGYTGVYVAYDDMTNAENPELLVESICMSIYQSLMPILDKSK